MPTLFVERGWRFHFFANEGDPREPAHVHVAKRGGGDAKLWLYPEVSVAYNKGLDARTLRWAVELVEARRLMIASAWDGFFSESD